MRPFFCLASRLLAISFLAVTTTSQAYAAPEVVVTIKPVYNLVASVMGNTGKPKLLIDSAASPHDFALKPSHAAMLQNADFVFWVSPKLETFLTKPLETIAQSSKHLAMADMAGMTLLKYREGEGFGGAEGSDHNDDHDHDHEAGGNDPHLWLDPENAMIFVTEVASALSAADPVNAANYARNADAEKTQIKNSISAIRTQMKPLANQKFMVFHDGFHYFEDRFGIAASGSISENPEVPPSAARISAVKRMIAAHNIKCVFAEPQFDIKLIDLVVENTDASHGMLDPIGLPLETYSDLLRALSADIATCLSAKPK